MFNLSSLFPDAILFLLPAGQAFDPGDIGA